MYYLTMVSIFICSVIMWNLLYIIIMSKYILYTDGAYSSSRDQGGIGLIFLKENNKILEYSKMYKGVTNNIMELLAVIVGLRFIKKPIDSLTIISDSMYVIGCAIKGWKRKKNIKLWEEFDKQYSRVKELCPNIEFKHIKGHQSGNNLTENSKWNNYVDRLATSASTLI